MSKKLVKRTTVWVYPPTLYGMRCDRCKGANIAWSEYEGCIWCYDCGIDTSGQGWPLDLVPFATSKLVIGPWCHHKVTVGSNPVLLELEEDGTWVPCKDFRIEGKEIVEVLKEPTITEGGNQ